MTPDKSSQTRDFKAVSRRELLKLAPVLALGAFTFSKLQEPLMNEGIGFSDAAAGTLYRKQHLAQTFSDAEVVEFSKFPYNGYDVIDPEVDLDNWRLNVSGAVLKPGDYTLEQIKSSRKIVQNVRHVCVEGWDVIGNYGGVLASDFLQNVGADTNSRFLAVTSADDYYESYDMDSVLHPQTLLCFEMYGKPLDRGHGAPLRLNMPTKLGYKQAKYITKIEVTNVLSPERGYWEDQGYSWHGGL